MSLTCGKCGKPVSIPDDPVLQAVVEAAGAPLCESCMDDCRAQVAVTSRPEPVVAQRPTKYVFRDGMGEISGFGGGYEQTCRNMLAAGLEWLDKHPSVEPRFREFQGVYGILSDDNDDAKALSKAVVDGADGDCTGAMHQAVVSACLWIHANSWERYCEEMSKPEAAEKEAQP